MSDDTYNTILDSYTHIEAHQPDPNKGELKIAVDMQWVPNFTVLGIDAGNDPDNFEDAVFTICKSKRNDIEMIFQVVVKRTRPSE